MTADTVLDRLGKLHPKLIDLSLDRVERLLGRLGDPHRTLPPVVHVAGTNGKGSVIAFLRAMLEAAGLRVHVYTSPHLVTFNERIRLAGDIIGDDDLTEVLTHCERANDGDEVTFFEITTAAAFLAFARTPADLVLLETGLGGRLDATNVIADPALTAITPVSLDHEKFLGSDLKGIAEEKAGILKRGVPCVCARQPRVALPAIEGRARDLDVRLVLEGKGYGALKVGEELVYRGDDSEMRYPQPALVGPHQLHNGAQAIACVEVLRSRLGLEVPDVAVGLGLKTVDWPGRLQRLHRGPLLETLPEGWELWLDGGHNPAAAQAVAAQARTWRDKPFYVVLGMMGGKDALGYIKDLKGRAQVLRTIDVPGEANGLPAETLAGIARSVPLDAQAADSVAAAVSDLAATQAGPARVLICGSLYLAGRVLADNG